jgi:hypothetical protein
MIHKSFRPSTECESHVIQSHDMPLFRSETITNLLQMQQRQVTDTSESTIHKSLRPNMECEMNIDHSHKTPPSPSGSISNLVRI